MPAADYLDALVDYRTMFPTLESLGEGDPPAAWEEERQKIRATTLDPVLATSSTMVDGQVSGVRNFDQRHRLRALFAVRAERDPSYVNPYTIEAAEPVPMRRLGSVVHT